MNVQPPKWADRFLEWYCNPKLLEEIQGDLYELFDEQVSLGRYRKARTQFVWLVLRSFRYSVISKKSTQNSYLGMTRNNLKLALRVLWRDKFNSSLNIIGLAIGIACFYLMGNYVRQELSFDRFHTKKDNIYRVWLKEDYGEGKLFFNSVTPIRFERLLEDHFSEFEQVVQYDINSFLVGEGDDRYNENIAIISPETFEVFDFRKVHGNLETPLPDKNSLILSQDYATKYFGQLDPVGKTMLVQIGEEVREFTVTMVFGNIPKESSIQFDMAISSANNIDIYGQRSMDAWFSVSPETYVLVGPNSDLSSVEEKLPSVVMGYLEGEVEEGVYNIGFQPLTDIHLNPDIPAGIAPVGNKDYVYILGMICILVLVVACINYTTLTVGQSLKRAKEVGVRKVMGAFNGSLVRQYLSESILLTLFAMVVGIGLTILALPTFNVLTGADAVLDFQGWHLGVIAILILVIGVSSGLYPAFVLSRMKATSILKGNSQPSRNHYIRKGMVVFQFVITVFLISSTLIIQRQLSHMQNMDLGFNYEAAVSVPLYPDPSGSSLSDFIIGTMENKGEILKEKLSQYPEISKIGMGSHVFGTPGWGNVSYTDDTETFRQFRVLFTDAHYFETFDIKVIDGRPFDPESSADKKEGIILNKAAADYFGFTEPVGKQLPGNDFGPHEIIGVTENFNYSSLHSAVEPLVIAQSTNSIYSAINDHNYGDSPVPKVVFKYTGSQLTGVREILEKEWEDTFPGEELNFSFVEENMRFQYENESRLNRLVIVSGALSLVIASLGLLGLVVLVTNSRAKEIGIRKIVGASVPTIFKTLVKTFAIQLLLGVVLSVPITYWFMNDWLSGFAYHIRIGPGIFIFSAVICMVIALFVISFHTLRAARVNPIESLRSE